ncbi:MAG: SdrD B-like domain-containing protein [Pirellulaceae bacterium]|nr:SdrD B-like domain-containing protein [Pirellulaceae bacterium]
MEFIKRLKERCQSSRNAKRRSEFFSPLDRRCRFETMEPRRMLDADPLFVAAVYIEEDSGNDNRGDTFEITFQGGAAGSELKRVIIDGDQIHNHGNAPGFGLGDVFFDTENTPPSATSNGFGADQAFPLQLGEIRDAAGGIRAGSSVSGAVVDGTSQLSLEFNGFFAGDTFRFTVDVDEVLRFDPTETDIVEINDGFDPLTSGAEFHGSVFTAHVAAPGFVDATGVGTFANRYDGQLDDAAGALGARLDVTTDDQDGIRDRTAGVVVELEQEIIPITIAGTVFYDRNMDLIQDTPDGEIGIENVTLSLFKQNASGGFDAATSASGALVQTVTDSHGDYLFDTSWGLEPGVYEVRETQPVDYPISVGSIPGAVAGAAVGADLTDNVLTSISIPIGGLAAIDYDFAESRPASIAGCVYHDRDDDGVREAGEEGIGGVRMELIDDRGSLVAFTLTDDDGCYSFDVVPPGVYKLQEIQPVGWFDGKDAAGVVDRFGVGQVAEGAAVEPDMITEIELLPEDAGVRYDFGERLGSIQGFVHADPDRDCEFDLTEAGIEGVLITLIDADGNRIETRTDASGRYEFNDLRVGSYTVVETQPAEFFSGGQVVGSGLGDASVDNIISNIQIGGGHVHLRDYNFCEHLGSLSGFVYHDRDDDGLREPADGEEAIAGVVIRLTDTAGQPVLDAGGTPRTAVTDPDGFYLFDRLAPGEYRLVEEHPADWVDGKDTPGQVNGAVVGIVSANDVLDQIHLDPATGASDGVNYNFGERLGSLRGVVHVDPDRDCQIDPDEVRLEGVTIHLLSGSGQLLQSTTTDADGAYQFDELPAGEYIVVEVQPSNYFHGGQVAGSNGGDDQFADVISAVSIDADAVNLVDYNFCETPPATLSGYVFQDGAPIVTENGQPPANLRSIRNGEFTPDDTPLAGVILELRNGLSGEPIMASDALPGVYSPGPLRTATNGDGFYEFTGLPSGNYAVYEVHPAGFFDGIDTAGTTSGIPINRGEPVSAAFLQQLTTNPGHDAIIRIPLGVGQASQLNNFSEVVVQVLPPPPPPEPPEPPLPPPANPPLPPQPLPRLIPPPAPQTIPTYGTAGAGGYSWHLSVINAGMPRGRLAAEGETGSVWLSVSHLDQANWQATPMQSAEWIQVNDGEVIRKSRFGIAGGIPVTGDFNGDGVTDIAVFYGGEWYLDLNGDGRWDETDLWARLGSNQDQPVTGDWDGDGKDDIGIFGPVWARDPLAIERDPGLPDSYNPPQPRPKNVPPRIDDATSGERLLQHTSQERTRADVIDHVFAYGMAHDKAIAGDWNGDGVSSIGVFRNGEWRLDLNGDGRWSDDHDGSFTFGQAGDLPVVGDFDGDGVDDIGVYRNGAWTLDTNHNRELDAHDKVFELGGAGELPVTGDWDGDGVDEPGVYRPLDPVHRQAAADDNNLE